jgi:hypothetical protein
MSKRANEFLQERVVLSFDHPSVTGDTTWKFFKVPAGRKLKIDAVEYLNPTGLAEDATNFFALSLKNGSTVMAGPLSTDSAGAGTNSIAADTFTAIPLSATAADTVASGGDVLSLLADEGGAATLPAGRLVVHARYVQ